MVYMDTNESNTHADPPLGSRWAQMWVHMWAQTLVLFLVYVTKGNSDEGLFVGGATGSICRGGLECYFGLL